MWIEAKIGRDWETRRDLSAQLVLAVVEVGRVGTNVLNKLLNKDKATGVESRKRLLQEVSQRQNHKT